MLLRCIARPLFASWFVVEAADQIRHPTSHAASVRAGIAALRGRARRVPALTRALDSTAASVGDRELGALVRAHGAAVLVAAGALALGKAPRAAGLALAVLTVPVAAASLPAGKVLGSPDEAEAARRRTFWFSLTALGGALLAAGDLAGRPGVAWRVQAAREARAAAREA